MKKIFTFAISLAFVVALCALSVFAAEEAEAKVNGVEYSSLQEAIDAAGNGDTVTLLKDLTIESTLSNAGKGIFNIQKDDCLTIDLNGKTINVTDNSSGNFIVFYNYGDLTIKNGSVYITSTVNRYWNAESAVILSRGGSITIENGSFIHNGGTDMAFALDISGNWFGDAYATINGGELRSTYRAIRMRMEDISNGASGAVYLTVNGGTIHGDNAGVWGQLASTYTGTEKIGNFDISGGTVSGGKNAISMGKTAQCNLEVVISGETVVDGNLNGAADNFSIKGGTFTVAPAEDFFADGFTVLENSDGSFGVKVPLEGAFTFIGYSINEVDCDSITAGYNVDKSILDAYCEQNSIAKVDFGCAFGVNAIDESKCISFSSYSAYQIFNAKIKGIDATNESHINAALAMAMYIDLGEGKSYVVEIDGKITLVDGDAVPTVTFGSFIG